MTQIDQNKIDVTGMTTVLEVISDKWASQILLAISEEHDRFGEIKRQIPDISTKMLTQTLRRLERNGIIERIDYEENPPRVEYQLTTLGKSLDAQMGSLCQWGLQHQQAIESAREDYDESQDGWI